MNLIALGYLDDDEEPCMPITRSSPCVQEFGLRRELEPEPAVPSKSKSPVLEWDWEEVGSVDYQR